MADLTKDQEPYIDTDNLPSMIVPLLLLRMKEYLETALQYEVPDTDPTKAILVKIGRFQDNPVEKNVSVSISGGDYDDPTYLDGRIDHADMDQFKIPNLSVSLIGGGQHWWRRGTMNYQTFFVRQRFSEEIAMKYAYGFYGRLLKAVETCVFEKFVDDYGERASGRTYVEGCSFSESGGTNQYIWRGKLKWRVLTWRP